MGLRPDIIYKKSIRVVFRQIDDVFLILPSSDMGIEKEVKYFTLNSMAYEIWLKIDGSRTIEQIVSELLEEYDVEKKELISDLEEFLLYMEKKGLIQRVNTCYGSNTK